MYVCKYALYITNIVSQLAAWCVCVCVSEQRTKKKQQQQIYGIHLSCHIATWLAGAAYYCGQHEVEKAIIAKQTYVCMYM